LILRSWADSNVSRHKITAGGRNPGRAAAPASRLASCGMARKPGGRCISTTIFMHAPKSLCLGL
jgi:hypothetical protein